MVNVRLLKKECGRGCGEGQDGELVEHVKTPLASPSGPCRQGRMGGPFLNKEERLGAVVGSDNDPCDAPVTPLTPVSCPLMVPLLCNGTGHDEHMHVSVRRSYQLPDSVWSLPRINVGRDLYAVNVRKREREGESCQHGDCDMGGVVGLLGMEEQEDGAEEEPCTPKDQMIPQTIPQAPKPAKLLRPEGSSLREEAQMYSPVSIGFHF